MSEASTADFIERRWLRDWPSANHAIMDAHADLEARGATFFRVNVAEMSLQLTVEGWIVQPSDQGDPPL
jgi:hypothetical protein